MEDWTCLGQHKRQPEFPVAAEAFREEGEELAGIARVSLKGPRRKAPLAAEPLQPGRDRGGEIGGRGQPAWIRVTTAHACESSPELLRRRVRGDGWPRGVTLQLHLPGVATLPALHVCARQLRFMRSIFSFLLQRGIP